jgi:hypothetical protein
MLPSKSIMREPIGNLKSGNPLGGEARGEAGPLSFDTGELPNAPSCVVEIPYDYGELMILYAEELR